MSTRTSRPVFSYTVSTMIDASPSQVWDLFVDLDVWWRASNPEPIAPDILKSAPLRAGSRLCVRERIAGAPGETTG